MVQILTTFNLLHMRKPCHTEKQNTVSKVAKFVWLMCGPHPCFRSAQTGPNNKKNTLCTGPYTTTLLAQNWPTYCKLYCHFWTRSHPNLVKLILLFLLVKIWPKSYNMTVFTFHQYLAHPMWNSESECGLSQVWPKSSKH